MVFIHILQEKWENFFFIFWYRLSYGWRGRIAQGNRSCSKALPGEVDKINRAGAEIDDFKETCKVF